MRLIKEIPHARYLIQVHEYNSKYLLKITLDSYEQIFKFDKDQFSNLDDIEVLLSDDTSPHGKLGSDVYRVIPCCFPRADTGRI